MKLLLLSILFALGVIIGTRIPADATACTIPNTFTAGTAAVASQVNANFTSLQSCGNNIDHTNIGAAGIYASQIIPDTSAHATFGGAVEYTFPTTIALTGVTGADCLGIDATHNVVAGAGTQDCVKTISSNGSGVSVSETGDTVTLGLIANLLPVYNISGTAQNFHVVYNVATVTGTTCVADSQCGTANVTLSGSATFTNFSSDLCVSSSQGTSNVIGTADLTSSSNINVVVYNPSNVSSTGNWQVAIICIGN